MSKSTREVIEEMNKALEEAESADGFFVALTSRKKDKLAHRYFRVKFAEEDLIPSLIQIEKEVEKDFPQAKIRRLDTRRWGK